MWKTAIAGQGHSSPVIQANKIWLTSATDQGRSLRALCFDARSGVSVFDIEVFTQDKPPEIDHRNSFATPTPVLAPGKVYVHFGSAGTACLSSETGQVLWRNDQFKVDYLTGPASSPILEDGLLLVHFDGADQQFVAAYEAHSGRVAWRTDRSAPYRDDPILKRAFCTPVVISVRNGTQLVCLGADQMQAYDVRTGTEMWQVRYSGTSNIAMPLVGRKRIYFSTGFRKPELWSVRVDGQGDVTQSHVEWKYTRQVPSVVSPLVIGERIYLLNETGIAACLNAVSGQAIWQERVSGNFSASMVYGAGHIYMSSEEGIVTVIRHADEYRVVAVNKLGEAIKATPAIADGAIIFRTAGHLFRVGNSSH